MYPLGTVIRFEDNCGIERMGEVTADDRRRRILVVRYKDNGARVTTEIGYDQVRDEESVVA